MINLFLNFVSIDIKLEIFIDTNAYPCLNFNIVDEGF